MTYGLNTKTLRWEFIESIEPPQIVQVRVQSAIAKENYFCQLTLRMHSKQVSSNNTVMVHGWIHLKDLGPVVQSVVSLTSLLRVILLTVLADSIYSILIFFAEKMWVAFALQKLRTFFQQKISAYLRITQYKF